jgi:hypothetical protein
MPPGLTFGRGADRTPASSRLQDEQLIRAHVGPHRNRASVLEVGGTIAMFG